MHFLKYISLKWFPLFQSIFVLLSYNNKETVQMNFKILREKKLKPIEEAVTFSGYVFRQAVNLRATLKRQSEQTLFKK